MHTRSPCSPRTSFWESETLLVVRPLCLGRLGDGWVIASESCALDHVGADYIREIEPGEAVLVDGDGIRTVKRPGQNGKRASCVFENIYFARPDSLLHDRLVYADRVRMGAELAMEHPVDADLVIGVPDSATAAAVGYAQRSGVPFGEGLVRNRYVGRTFIEPNQHFRDLGGETKVQPDAGHHTRQAAGRRGRQHRPGYDDASRRQAAPQGRRE